MRRLYQAGALAALGVGLGTAPFAVGCWGDEFTAAPPVGGLGGASSASGALGPSSGAGATAGIAAATNTGGSLPEGCGTATLMADADTYVDGMFADDNYDHKALADDELEIYQFGATSKRILIYFNVTFWIPENYQILSARLELVLSKLTRDFGTIDVHKLLLPESNARPPWDERFVTWNRYTSEALWTTPGGDFDPTVSASAPMEADWPEGTVVAWDVTADVQQFYAGGPNAGWLLKETNDPVDGLGLGYVFYGRETEVAAPPEGDPNLDAGSSDANEAPSDPGSDPAPNMPDPTTTGTTGATTAGAGGATTTMGTTTAGASGAGGTGGAGGGSGMPDAGATDSSMEEEGSDPGPLPRLLVDVCPI